MSMLTVKELHVGDRFYRPYVVVMCVCVCVCLGAYFCLNMIIITLSTFLSIIVLNLYIRGDRRNHVPLWLRRVTRKLSSIEDRRPTNRVSN